LASFTILTPERHARSRKVTLGSWRLEGAVCFLSTVRSGTAAAACEQHDSVLGTERGGSLTLPLRAWSARA